MSDPREKTGERLPPRQAPPARPRAAAEAPGAGRPLDAPARAAMEAAFGHDFSRVRVHDDAAAAERARGAGAHAFTSGRDVVFGAGRYRPSTSEGRKLLAHELAHVVQQEGRSPGSASPPRLVPAGHASERAADAAAEQVAGRGPAVGAAAPLPGGLRAAPLPAGPLVQRQPAGGGGSATAESEWSGPPAPAASPAQPGSLTSLGIPGLDPAAAMRIADQKYAPVREWLDANTSSLMLLSGAGIVARVRRHVAEAADMADAEILGEAHRWAARHDHVIPAFSAIPEPGEGGIPGAPAGKSLADSEIVGAVKSAFSVAMDGVGIRREHGRAVVSVKGVTVGLAQPGKPREGQFEAAGTIGWSGSMGVTARHGDVHFGATISADRWDVTLSFPGDSPAPMLAQLGRIFGRAERGLQGIVRGAGSIPLTDLDRLKAAIDPHVQPITEAVQAASGVAAASKQRVNVGVRASGPGPASPGASGPSRPDGISVTATVIFAF